MVAPALPGAAMAKLVSTPGSIGWVAGLVKTGPPEARFRPKSWWVAPSALVATRLKTCLPAGLVVAGVPLMMPVVESSASPVGSTPLETIDRLSTVWLLWLTMPLEAPRANCQLVRSAALTLPARFMLRNRVPS